MKFLSLLKPAGTNSFRLATSKYFEFGGNSQNMDKSVLDIFVAPEGHTIIQVDQSGAEALIVAYLAMPGRYRDLFLAGIKPHVYVALQVFWQKFVPTKEEIWCKPPAELKARPDWKVLDKTVKSSAFEYDLGKKINHASNYMMGPRTFQLSVLKESEGTVVLSHQECSYFLGVYRDLFPEIVMLQQETIERVRATRRLVNLLGFPRTFERNFSDSYFRESVSWVPQSTVGCITHAAYKRFYDDIKAGEPAQLVNNKHDSYAALVPDAEVPRLALKMQQYMQVPLVGRDGVEFMMRAEVQTGKNFRKASAANPNGMKDYEFK